MDTPTRARARRRRAPGRGLTGRAAVAAPRVSGIWYLWYLSGIWYLGIWHSRSELATPILGW